MINKVNSIKDSIREAIRKLEDQNLTKFKIQQVRDNMNLPSTIKINHSWLIECMHRFGYFYSRSEKLWIKFPTIKATKSTYIKLEEYEKLKKKIDKMKDILGEANTAIANDDYCGRCKRQLFCKQYNRFAVSFWKFFARKDICQEHRELLDIIGELGVIVYE